MTAAEKVQLDVAIESLNELYNYFSTFEMVGCDDETLAWFRDIIAMLGDLSRSY